MASTAMLIIELAERLPRRALVFVDRPRLAPAIVPAVRAHPVRRLRLVAMRALAQANRLKSVVSPALGRPCLGVSSFGIWHREFLTRRMSAARRAASRPQAVSGRP